MPYRVIALHLFREQIATLSPEACETIDKKIDLLKENPFRFKRLLHRSRPLFRIRVTDRHQDLRLIYTVDGEDVLLIGVLDRKKGYRDLLEMLARAFKK